MIPIDYSSTGMDLQRAFVDHFSNNKDPALRADHVLLNGHKVFAFLCAPVPKEGRFRIEFLSPPREIEQGVDVRFDNGTIRLPNGEKVKLLRTWLDPRLADVVEYPYRAPKGIIRCYNVFMRKYGENDIREEKMTGNAGFLLEQPAPNEWVFHCSAGPLPAPDFEYLVFRLTLLPK